MSYISINCIGYVITNYFQLKYMHFKNIHKFFIIKAGSVTLKKIYLFDLR